VATSTPVGWPFLVAPGRRRDYTILLAPGFLVADLDHGVLERVTRPDGGDDRPTTVDTSTGRGRRLSVVYATHLLTAADLDRGDPDGGVPDGAGARDEHGRPLRLIYGYATRDGRVVEPASADLGRAREEALRAYRSFLADEEGAAVAGTGPFRLASTVEASVPVGTGSSDVPAGTGRRVGVLAALVGAVVLVLVAVGATLLARGPAQPAGPPARCPSVAGALPGLPASGPASPSCRPSARP
jgi:hypothetical protein